MMLKVEMTFDTRERIDWLRIYAPDKSWSDIAVSYNLNGSVSEQLVKEYDNKGNLTGMSLYQPQPIMSMQQAGGGGGGGSPMSQPGSHLDRVETTTYDDLGNRVSVVADHGFGIIKTDTYTTNDFNQYTRIDRGDPNAIAYLNYDVAGNTTEDSQGYLHYYDEENRLVEIADPNNDTLVEFAYDALGRRIKKYDVDSDCTTYFYHDKMGRVIAEFEQVGSGSIELKRSYVWGNGFDEIVGMFNPGTAASGDPNDLNNLNAFVTTWLLDANDVNFNSNYDNPSDNFIDYLDFATLNSGWTYTPAKPEQRWYYMKDALGSTMGLVGSHPNASSEFHLYDVYGKPNTTSAIGNPFYYTGKPNVIYAGSNLLGYNISRYLDFSTGRWMIPDTGGYIDGLNLYEYVSSNPIMNIDPLGLGVYKIGSAEPLNVPFELSVLISQIWYDRWERTWKNKLQREDIKNRTALTLAGGFFTGMVHAFIHFAHFTTNRGTEIDIKYPSFIRQDPAAKLHFNTELKSAALFVDRNKFTGIRISSKQDESSGASTFDWIFAVGGYYTWGKGENISCSNGTYRMKFTQHFRDLYDWKIDGDGIGGLVTDREMAMMHRWGEYQEFKMKGKHSINAQWPVGKPSKVTYSGM